MRILTMIFLSALSLGGCASVEPPPAPKQGSIPAASGGVAGYQHGVDGSRFAIGEHARRDFANGYLKRAGDEGTLAISATNGSVFGVPNAHAKGLSLPPYGVSPTDHDAFVRDYFTKLGIGADQVSGVRGMTMLEASGRTDETTRAIPRITAYYSVLQRTVGRIAVPDSFAWARANSEGTVVAEGVYWPALPAEAVANARRFEEMLSDPRKRPAFEALVPVDATQGVLAIRHSSATEGRFEAFASFDVTIRVAVNAAQSRASAGGTVLVRHFDIDGKERFLPQETLTLQDKYPEQKAASR